MPPRLRARCVVCGSLAFVEKFDQEHKFNVLWQIFGGRGKISYLEADPKLKAEIRKKIIEKLSTIKI